MEAKEPVMIDDRILDDLNACDDAATWAKGKTAREAWDACPHPVWLTKAAATAGVDRVGLVKAGAECMRYVKGMVTYEWADDCNAIATAVQLWLDRPAEEPSEPVRRLYARVRSRIRDAENAGSLGWYDLWHQPFRVKWRPVIAVLINNSVMKAAGALARSLSAPRDGLKSVASSIMWSVTAAASADMGDRGAGVKPITDIELEAAITERELWASDVVRAAIPFESLQMDKVAAYQRGRSDS